MQTFSPQEIGLLTRLGVCVTIQPGAMLYFEGDPADKIYYILKGRVRVLRSFSNGREVTLDVVEAGHVIGESAFVEGGVRPATVQAVNTVQLISCRPGDLLPHFRTEPELALHFLQQCSNTMDRLAARLHDQCLLDRYGKVASFILDLSATDSPEKGTVGGTIPYTHENLADSLGLSRSTVSTVIKEFENRGWLQIGYRWVKVLDRQALAQFVQTRTKDGGET